MRSNQTNESKTWRIASRSLLLLAVCYSLSVPASAESMQSAIQDTIFNHPEVAALLANRSAIGEELNQAKGLFRPEVSVEAQAGYLNDDNTSQSYKEAGVKLVQPLFDGGKARSERNRQNERVDSASSRASDAATSIALQTIQAYLEVQRAHIGANIAAENLKSTSALVGRVRGRVNAGLSDDSDMQQANARLLAAKDSLAEAKLNAMDAEALYETITGHAPGKLTTPPLPRKQANLSLPALLENAKNRSSKIAALLHDANAAEAAINTAQAELMPKLNLELSANYHDAVEGSNAENTTYKSMLALSFNLGTNGITRSRVREARARAEEAHHQADAAKLGLQRELKLAWNTVKTMDARVDIYRREAKSNRALVGLRLDQYEGGRGSLISVLDAQNETYIARLKALNIEYSGGFAFYKMLAVSGNLLTALNVDDPAHRN